MKKSNNYTESVVIYLTPAQKEILKNLKQSTHMSMSEILRPCIIEYITQKKLHSLF